MADKASVPMGSSKYTIVYKKQKRLGYFVKFCLYTKKKMLSCAFIQKKYHNTLWFSKRLLSSRNENSEHAAHTHFALNKRVMYVSSLLSSPLFVLCLFGQLHTVYRYISGYKNLHKAFAASSIDCTNNRKGKRPDSVLWQKPLHPKKNPKKNATTPSNTGITQRLRLRKVSKDNDSHPTCVVKLVYGIQTFPPKSCYQKDTLVIFVNIPPYRDWGPTANQRKDVINMWYTNTAPISLKFNVFESRFWQLNVQDSLSTR